MNVFPLPSKSVEHQPAMGIPGFLRLHAGRRRGQLGNKGPVHEKGFLKSGRHGPGAAKMDILHAASLRQGHKMMVAYVHAAGKGDIAVTGQHLSMRAQIDGEHGRPQTGRQKHLYLHPSCGEPAPGLAQGIDHAAESVHNEPDVDAPLRRLAEGLGKGASRLVAFEYIGGKAYHVPGPAYGIQHGRIGLFAVFQKFQPVAAHHGPAGDGPSYAQCLPIPGEIDIFLRIQATIQHAIRGILPS